MFGRIRIFLVLHVLGILGGAFIRIVPANTHYPVLRYSAFDIFQVIVAAEPHEGSVAVSGTALSVMRAGQSIQNTNQPRTHHGIPAVIAAIGYCNHFCSVRRKFFSHRFNGFDRNAANIRKIFQRMFVRVFFQNLQGRFVANIFRRSICEYSVHIEFCRTALGGSLKNALGVNHAVTLLTESEFRSIRQCIRLCIDEIGSIGPVDFADLFSCSFVRRAQEFLIFFAGIQNDLNQSKQERRILTGTNRYPLSTGSVRHVAS